ncbi:hypothetical protein SPBR_03561 [Sporothrix brasiliensis 5110]|uniref:NACHT domain-containing protein n=1 Tax=Sporothrix brasiliensis 5110 TaxID=1398154 RepID=A0A0C2J7A8_9PEZI|nr:uncharacterized protein SPBR_03561 [Sporothrix brasiliensis 5110]KIH94875.1 hypothetical protein SPBR_03561 [Sporothrix brasiliensis 5110]
MVDVFKERPTQDDFIDDAASLAPILDRYHYQLLIWSFVDALTKGTTDGQILQPRLCDTFVRVIRWADRLGDSAKNDSEPIDMRLGPVLESMKKRLDAAGRQAEPGTQYQLISTLGSILDAMNDAKRQGIDRESLHEPLMDELKTLRKAENIRLAQASSYAYQALLSIPDNEGPAKALLRHTVKIVGSASKVAGAVSTADPSKLFDGLFGLTDLPELIESMVAVVASAYNLVSDVKAVKENGVMRRPKGWYIALRYSDMLMRARSFQGLESFVKAVPCGIDVDFQCGLYAQLERAWGALESSNTSSVNKDKQALRDIAVIVPSPKGGTNDLKLVMAWRETIKDCFGLPLDMRTDAEQRMAKKTSKLAVFVKQKAYSSQVAYLKPAAVPSSTALLTEAWHKCSRALVFYADEELRRYYLASGEEMLKIKRISGATLPMSDCYINLAIVEKSQKTDGRHELNDGDYARRVMLDGLFGRTKRDDGNVHARSRLFIWGRAGVGKTTLCKKIVHELTRAADHTDLPHWFARFDRVLWLPLRKLKLYNLHPGYQLSDILKDEYFARQADGSSFAEALARQCTGGNSGDDSNDCNDGQGGTGRTLFLLDGLDEVSQLLDPEHKANRFLHWLLDRPSAIITSRPGVSVPLPLRLECDFETVGFTVEQVQQYIKTTMPTEVSDNMLLFLHSRPRLLNLVRIPVQLDAFSYVWNEDRRPTDNRPTDNLGSSGALRSESKMATMTDVYDAITRKLWRKDIPRVRGPHDANNFTDATVRRLADDEVVEEMQGEVHFVQALAFAAFYHEVVIFEQSDCVAVRKYADNPPMKGFLNHVLANLSCLRASDASSLDDEDATHRTYHFIHLTYQEFFAAQFFARQWTAASVSRDGKGRMFTCPKLGNRKQVRLSAHAYLQKNKYSTRHNIFWRFVAGLLRIGHGDAADIVEDKDSDDGEDGGEGDDEQLDFGNAAADTIKSSKRIPDSLRRFFHALEQEPRDLLGPVHLRLVVSCLDEADPRQNTPYFDLHRDMLRRWMLWECQKYNNSHLAGLPAFPFRVVEAALEDAPDALSRGLMASIAKCSTITSKNYLFRLCNYVHPDKYPSPLSSLAFFTLQNQSILSRDVIEELLGHLRRNNYDGDDLEHYFNILWKTQNVMLYVAELIKDSRPNIQKLAGWILRRTMLFSRVYPREAVTALVSVLRNIEMHLPSNMVEVVFSDSLPREATDALLMRLRHKDHNVVLDMIHCIVKIDPLHTGFYAYFPKPTSVETEVFVEVVSLMKSPNVDVAKAALDLLKSKDRLQWTETDAFDILFEHADEKQQTAIERAMHGTRATLPPSIMAKVRAQLQEANDQNQLGAIRLLENQTLPDDILAFLLRKFDEVKTSCEIRIALARTLGSKGAARPSLVLDRLVTALKDADDTLAPVLFNVLWHEDLPESIAAMLVECISMDNIQHVCRRYQPSYVRKPRMPHLPEPAMSSLVAKYQALSRREDAQNFVLTVLHGHTASLPEHVIISLHDEHRRLREESRRDESVDPAMHTITTILSSRITDTPCIRDYFVDMLYDTNVKVVGLAVRGLAHPDRVDDAVFDGLTHIALHSDNADLARQATTVILLKKSLSIQQRYTAVKAVLKKPSITRRETFEFLEAFISSPGVDLRELAGSDQRTLLRFFGELFEQSRTFDITWFTSGESHFVISLSDKSFQFPKEHFVTFAKEVQEYLGIPRALTQM